MNISKHNLEVYWNEFVNKHELEFMDNQFPKDTIFDFVKYANNREIECSCEHCANERLSGILR